MTGGHCQSGAVLGAELQADFKVDDRMGDIALIEGKHEEAKTRFTSAYKGMDESTEYRRLIEVKLGILGVDVASPEFKK